MIFSHTLSDAAFAIERHANFDARDPFERQRLKVLAQAIRAEGKVQSKLESQPQPAEPTGSTSAPPRRRHRYRLRAADAFIGIGSGRIPE